MGMIVNIQHQLGLPASEFFFWSNSHKPPCFLQTVFFQFLHWIKIYTLGGWGCNTTLYFLVEIGRYAWHMVYKVFCNHVNTRITKSLDLGQHYGLIQLFSLSPTSFCREYVEIKPHFFLLYDLVVFRKWNKNPSQYRSRIKYYLNSAFGYLSYSLDWVSLAKYAQIVIYRIYKCKT